MRDGVRIVNCTHADPDRQAALLVLIPVGGPRSTPSPGTADGSPRFHLNVIAVPHLSQNTVESQRETSRLVAEQVLDALRGDDYRNVVNLPYGPGAEYLTCRPYVELAEKLGRLLGQLAEREVRRVEVEVQGDGMQPQVRPIAAALLSGLLRRFPAGARPINTVNAPVIAHEQGIETRQVVGMELVDYPNLISCRAHWEGGSQVVAGVLSAGGEARLVQCGSIRVDVKLEVTCCIWRTGRAA
jgi:D-3-phosphoglycerate dehydrogenase